MDVSVVLGRIVPDAFSKVCVRVVTCVCVCVCGCVHVYVYV
jgi:hypothetical protein